jgi:hypothetical protein
MKLPFAAAIGSIVLASAVAVPVIAADNDPQVGAYLSWKFGAAKQAGVPENFRYGLRLDYDSYVAMQGNVPPTLLLNVSGDKQINAFLNGSNLTELATRLNQAEAAAAGGSTALTAAAVVAGVAVVAVVASNSSDDNDEGIGGTTGGATTGGNTGGNTGGSGGGNTGGGGGGNTGGSGGGNTGGSGGGGNTGGNSPLGGLGGILGVREWRQSVSAAPAPGGAEPRGIDSSYQQWLDGGTGHMGDLH